MKPQQLPIPAFYRDEHAASWTYSPDQRGLFSAAIDWRQQHNIKPVSTDRMKIALALIDLQKDFCFPEGTLFVGGRSGQGAIEDNQRIARFIYQNLASITDITTTLDTHFAYQIFFPSFWNHADGTPVQPHTVISADEVESGKYVPNLLALHALPGFNGNYMALKKQVLHYCRELERTGKYKLYIWPEHCMLGSDGHALAGVIHAARLFHSFARGGQNECEVKGGNPITENYSVFGPEVLSLYNGTVVAQRNHKLVGRLVKYDRLIFAGQAASHCVASSVRDFLREISAIDPALIKKVYLMEDCMSAVAVPDGNGGFFVDYTKEAEAALEEFKAAGMHVVKSTDPMETWPDFYNVATAV
jgi:nicotinamidase-related amidase